ncbi:hypothetical protein Barb4_03249 [Bacteroidales bacterium Barb4]|nr:hypothetical protein Barb4_03249 [Bacteroidales bacterium Barb4]
MQNIPLLVGGDQFRAYRRGDYIRQSKAGSLVRLVVGYPPHEVLHQCFGNACVHAVHGYMVAVVGSPSESQFGEVARADHQAVCLIGNVHQYLRALARLSVLVGNVVIFSVMPYVFEMLFASRLDGNLAECDAQRTD